MGIATKGEGALVSGAEHDTVDDGCGGVAVQRRAPEERGHELSRSKLALKLELEGTLYRNGRVRFETAIDLEARIRLVGVEHLHRRRMRGAVSVRGVIDAAVSEHVLLRQDERNGRNGLESIEESLTVGRVARDLRVHSVIESR